MDRIAALEANNKELKSEVEMLKLERSVREAVKAADASEHAARAAPRSVNLNPKGGAGEYDVPQCQPGEECVHTTESYFRVGDSMRKCSALSDVWCAPNWDEEKDVLLLRAGTIPSC